MGDSVDWCSLGESLPDAFAMPAWIPGPWDPLDLAQTVKDYHTGKTRVPQPTMLTAALGGLSLLYPGKSHVFAGEPESCKGWLAVLACSQCLAAGGRILYIDFEDDAETFTRRMLLAGAAPLDLIQRADYLRPDAPPDDLPQILTDMGTVDLAVIDGVSEAYAVLGLDDWRDVPRFLNSLVRPLIDTGAAVVQIDHVTKSVESRGRNPIGGQGKLAGVDVLYSVDAVEIPCVAPGRENDGWAVIRKQKDRPGGVPGERSQKIGRLDVRASDGPGKLELTALDLTGDEAAERIRGLLERDPSKGLSLGQLETWLGWSRGEVAQAVRRLDSDPDSGMSLSPHGQSMLVNLRDGSDHNLDAL